MQFQVKFPVPGFESVEAFELTPQGDHFAALVNAAGPMPSLTLINPFVLRPYDIEIPLAVRALMDLDEKSNILAFCPVVIKEPLEESNINFLAPIIFNVDNATMAQVVLAEDGDERYPCAQKLGELLPSGDKA